MVEKEHVGRDGFWNRIGLRLLISLLCIASLILLLKSRQTVQRSVGLGFVSQSVKYSDTTGFTFLVYGDILTAAYGIIACAALLPSACRGQSSTSRCSGKCAGWMIFIFDQAVAYVLLSAVCAATEVLYLADKGLAKTQWQSLCPTFGFFCHMVTASIVIGFIAVILLAVLSVLSARSLFHNCYTRAVYTTKMHRSILT